MPTRDHDADAPPERLPRKAGAAPAKGRGATFNPGNRFRSETREAIDDGWGLPPADEARAAESDPVAPRHTTSVRVLPARSIVTRNQSPDIGFTQSVNPYQGCEHGCVYCFARPTHAYHDLSPGLDFETRLFAKRDAPALLRAELARPGYRCESITLGINTDGYQPIERDWRITRGCLEVLHEFDHPVSIVTKSALIERDLDLLAPMAAKGLAQVHVSVTSLDREISRRMEPRAPAPERRLQTIAALVAAGVPCGVLVAPVIPRITDQDMEAILEAAAARGAKSAGYVLLRLPREVSPLFRDWLRAHFPLRADHVMSLVQQMRGGKDYDSRWGARLRGTGTFADLIARRFARAAARCGLDRELPALDTTRFRPPVRIAPGPRRTTPSQGSLF